ncbi:MAG: hypothetical protein GWN58_56525, partial [Anaerolineae bacterium]|nr:hypothetical protein [Anaerolineae bacterium]
AIDKQRDKAREQLQALADKLDANLVDGLLNAEERDEADIHEQRQRIEQLRAALAELKSVEAKAKALLGM